VKEKDFAGAGVSLDRPFSQEELNMALKRTHLEVPA